MVRYLNARARREGLGNLFGLYAAPDDPLIPEPVDLILIVNTAHDLPDRPAYFQRLREYLRPGGRVAIIDYRMREIPIRIPESRRLPLDRLRNELNAASYRILAEHDFLPYQYFIIASPAPTRAPP